LESSNEPIQNSDTLGIIRVLNLMNLEELNQLYTSLNIGPHLSSEATEEFIVKKIVEKASKDSLLGNRSFVLKTLDHHGMIASGLEKILNEFNRDTLVEIWKELKNAKIPEDEKKPLIIQKLLSEISFDKIWKSRSLRKKIALKKSSKADFQKIRTQIAELGEAINNAKKEYIERTSIALNEINHKIETSEKELNEIKLVLKPPKDPSLQTLLKALYDQAIEIDGQLSAEIINEQENQLLKKLNTNELWLTFKELQAFVLHYLLQNVKNLSWLPSTETFMKVVKEELNKIKGSGGKAEIPKLRELVCPRMGLTEEVFDSMLTSAWNEGFIELESGAPITRSEVKYLVTKSGSIFYYVRLKS